MRTTFEAWAQGDGHIVRRREDKPDEYLIFETQRRWVIWQAALTHGKAAKPAKAPARARAPRAPAISADEATVRNRVLNEVLAAFSNLERGDGMEGVVEVIQSLKQKRLALAEERQDD